MSPGVPWVVGREAASWLLDRASSCRSCAGNTRVVADPYHLNTDQSTDDGTGTAVSALVELTLQQ
eukprot:5202464-Prymnesium_polylepis.3